MNPAMIDALLDVHHRAHAAGYGGRSTVYADIFCIAPPLVSSIVCFNEFAH